MTSLPSHPRRSDPRPHLQAGLAALFLALAIALGGSLWARNLVTRRFDALRGVMAESKSDGQGDPDKATYLDRLNSLGTTLQREAFARPDQLPIYGSSELVRPVADKAGLFFRDYPTGFAVYPVGRAGTDSFLFLQRIASLGRVTRGKRVAISLSPTWFFLGHPEDDAYDSNFSKSQALSALLNAQFSDEFRHAFARRLLDHPAPLVSDRLLDFLAGRLAGTNLLDRTASAVGQPLARMERAIHTVQDRFEVAIYIMHRLAAHDSPAAPRKPVSLDWERLIAEATERSNANSFAGAVVSPSPIGKTRDEIFRDCVERGAEWEDFELLLRGMHEMGMQPLILCMPPQVSYYERTGVSKEALTLFSEKIRSVSARWGATAETFDDHARDLKFQMGHGDHLSNRGWMYYNRVLDQFYHGTLDQTMDGRDHRHRTHPSTVRAT